jgi:hypothetical protein
MLWARHIPELCDLIFSILKLLNDGMTPICQIVTFRKISLIGRYMPSQQNIVNLHLLQLKLLVLIHFVELRKDLFFLVDFTG